MKTKRQIKTSKLNHQARTQSKHTQEEKEEEEEEDTKVVLLVVVVVVDNNINARTNTPRPFRAEKQTFL